jgi:uncharacterized membrane protein YuzA (DUF378 family)
MPTKTLHMVAFVLVIAGSLNWLLYGLFGWQVGYLLGEMAVVLYVVIGIAGLYELFTHKRTCYACTSGEAKAEAMPETVS